MKLRRVTGGAVLCAVALTAGLSAAPQQTTDDQAPRVIKTLPPVSFAGAPQAKNRRAEPPAAIANRQHAEAALRALMAARKNGTRIKTICGLTVIEQSPDLDASILMPPDPRSGAAIRKIEPQTCRPDSAR